MSKVVSGIAEALSDLSDGARVMVGGFGLSGNPEALIAGVRQRAPRGLTLISNNAGAKGRFTATWLQDGLVDRIVCTYVGGNPDLQAAIDAGEITVEIVPQGTFTERMRAAGAGIPAFFTPTGAGTVVAEGKEVRELDGRPCLLEHALHGDFALVRAAVADPFGNVRFRGTSRNFGVAMAMAARTTIIEAERVVTLGELGPEDIHLPGVFVQRVVHVPEHHDPIEYRTVREAP